MALNQNDTDRLIGRAIRDEEFRKRLLADPENTLRGEGFPVDPDVVQAIKNLQSPQQVEQAAQSFAAATGLSSPVQRTLAGPPPPGQRPPHTSG